MLEMKINESLWEFGGVFIPPGWDAGFGPRKQDKHVFLPRASVRSSPTSPADLRPLCDAEAPERKRRASTRPRLALRQLEEQLESCCCQVDGGVAVRDKGRKVKKEAESGLFERPRNKLTL